MSLSDGMAWKKEFPPQPIVVTYSDNTINAAIKFDNEKNQVELFSPIAFNEISKVLTFGAKKYAADNWRKGMNWRRLIGAALRHLMAWARGENVDPETGLSHLAHLGCCVMFLIEYEVTKTGTDDRYIIKTS